MFVCFVFLFFWGDAYMYRENDKRQLCFKYEWDAFLLMDVENNVYIIQQCKVFYVSKDSVQLSVQNIIWHSNQVLGQ